VQVENLKEKSVSQQDKRKVLNNLLSGIRQTKSNLSNIEQQISLTQDQKNIALKSIEEKTQKLTKLNDLISQKDEVLKLKASSIMDSEISEQAILKDFLEKKIEKSISSESIPSFQESVIDSKGNYFEISQEPKLSSEVGALNQNAENFLKQHSNNQQRQNQHQEEKSFLNNEERKDRLAKFQDVICQIQSWQGIKGTGVELKINQDGQNNAYLKINEIQPGVVSVSIISADTSQQSQLWQKKASIVKELNMAGYKIKDFTVVSSTK